LYQVYQMKRNVNDSLNILCLGPESAIMNILLIDISFIQKIMIRIERPIIVMGLTSNEFEVNYYGKLKEVI